MKTISQAYLLGIQEGRALMRQFERDGIPITLETARSAAANVTECLSMGFAGEMRDCLRGERDFWARQCLQLTKKGI